MNAIPPARLEPLLEALEHASDLTDLQRLIEQFRDLLRVDHMVYHWVSGAGEQYGCGTYSPTWVQRYLDQDYVRVDPVIQGCYKLFHPVDWKRLDCSGGQPHLQ
jgi:methyl coenzyme M reductase beta subunit